MSNFKDFIKSINWYDFVAVVVGGAAGWCLSKLVDYLLLR